MWVGLLATRALVASAAVTSARHSGISSGAGALARQEPSSNESLGSASRPSPILSAPSLDVISALHLTQAALRQAHSSDADSDADMLGQDAAIFQAATGSGNEKEELKKLEVKLRRLEARYDALMKEAEGDRAVKLHDIACGIKDAEEKLKRLQAQQEVDISSQMMPYPQSLEPFGGEIAARNLTEGSVAETEGMVDQIEKAQAVESQRAVFRALTHLRGATITAYDGIAKSHMKNVEEYEKNHNWRKEHQVRHLAEEEDDVKNWAYPAGGVVAPPSAVKAVGGPGAPPPSGLKPGDSSPSPAPA